jgi:hypothetical protein
LNPFLKNKKKIRKLKKNGFLTLTILKEKRKLFLLLSKEKTGSSKVFYF